MTWLPFNNDGKEYNLSHLDTFDWVVSLDKMVGGPLVDYKFQVMFSDHTFTSSPERNPEGIPYSYGESSGRLFDFGRYESSKLLPEIIRNLGSRKCFVTNDDYKNYLTIEVVQEDSLIRDYIVYFAVSRMEKRKGWMRLYVESAYLRDLDRKPVNNEGRKMGFNVIARNTIENRKINRRKK